MLCQLLNNHFRLSTIPRLFRNMKYWKYVFVLSFRTSPSSIHVFYNPFSALKIKERKYLVKQGHKSFWLDSKKCVLLRYNWNRHITKTRSACHFRKGCFRKDRKQYTQSLCPSKMYCIHFLLRTEIVNTIFNNYLKYDVRISALKIISCNAFLKKGREIKKNMTENMISFCDT